MPCTPQSQILRRGNHELQRVPGRSGLFPISKSPTSKQTWCIASSFTEDPFLVFEERRTQFSIGGGPDHFTPVTPGNSKTSGLSEYNPGSSEDHFVPPSPAPFEETNFATGWISDGRSVTTTPEAVNARFAEPHRAPDHPTWRRDSTRDEATSQPDRSHPAGKLPVWMQESPGDWSILEDSFCQQDPVPTRQSEITG